MLKQKWRLITAIVFFFDLCLTLVAFYLAYHFRNRVMPLAFPEHFTGRLYPFILYKQQLILPVLFVWSFFLWYFSLYNSHRTHALTREFFEVLKVVIFSTLFFLGYIFVAKIDFVSRPWLVLFAIINLMLLLAAKTLLRLTARIVRKRGFNYRNLLIVGDGPNAVKLADLVTEHPHWGYRFLGYLSDGAEPVGQPSLGSLEELSEVLTREVVDDVIFVLNRRKLEDLRDPILTCQEMGINTRIALQAIPRLGGNMFLEEIDHTPLLTLTRTPTNLLALITKRWIDVILSSLLLFFSSPFLALFSLLIKLGSKGPVYFRQVRVGLNGRKFTLYKFRTMDKDAEERLDEVRHLNEMDGPVFKVKKDPRVTGTGRFLRKFSLDELPQLWNVLKGDMSLVGPRPPIPEEVEKYEKWQRRRLSMKPGLTCIWQISGRNKIDFKEWMELDLKYIDNWSLGLDFKIMLKTIPAVLIGKGAR